jgi:Rad3-related DNA helicase
LLSATIGSADDLSRRTGISGIRSLPIPARFRHAVPGKRLLIFPENEAREKDMEKLAFEAAGKLKKSVWLCASSAEANTWSQRLEEDLKVRKIDNQPIFVAKAQAEEIDQFIEAKTGHLFTAARYDGMDFEGEVCRLVIMPTLPQACGAFERFVSENLADASFMASRVLQRMKQALGRATRNDHDWAIYVLLKNTFSQYLTSSGSFEQFPSNVQEEIAYAVDVSTKSLEDIGKTINGFRSGKLAEIQFPQKAVSLPEDTVADVSHVADKEVDFWNKVFVTHSFDQAAVTAEEVAGNLESHGQPGYALFWRYLKAYASYLRNSVDKDAAGLANAKNELTRILDEPRQSAWFSRLNRLRQTLNLEAIPEEADFEEFDCIAASWNHLLSGDLRNSKKHEQFFEDLKAALCGSDHKQFCHAMRNLFRLLGWEAEIREKGQGETDVIATVSVEGKHYLLIVEGKPEME